jgi:UDP-N-acetylglucosamine diphosphorylase/glucosamine-1-phosphate N-acetyltransferase
MYTLFDGSAHKQLLPLTFTKPVAELRVGIFTIKEKWEHFLQQPTTVRTAPYLSAKFKGNDKLGGIGINASVLPTDDLADVVKHLQKNHVLTCRGKLIAINPLPAADADMGNFLSNFTKVEYDLPVSLIEHSWDIFKKNDQEIRADFEIVLRTKVRAKTSGLANTLVNEKQIFIEDGAKVTGAFLNASEGPIFIGKSAEVMEGSLVRGPFALCEHATLKLGAKVYGATTIGPYCKVGGEVNNVVMQSYSNKGHDGFLGNSVIGEWCNLGADTNCSNLKNNYGLIKVYSYTQKRAVDTGLQFCGLIMGDHSKSGINTMFNTGTVVGVSANIYGGDFPPKYIPSFSWGGAGGFVKFDLSKAIDVAKKMMSRREVAFTDEDAKIFQAISKL